jgi:L-glyceraldehyde 3-phosphate reductase
MRTDFAPYRDELILSTKAGYEMWPGPYGDRGSRKYLLASLDASLKRMSVDYVDIFYSHRADPDTPLEETICALDAAVRQGKALYAGISSYSPDRSIEAAAIAERLGTPLVIHQPSYSMLNRWIEEKLLLTLEQEGLGSIGFGSLAQGLLSDRYVESADPERAQDRGSFDDRMANEDNRERLRGLAEIAKRRGQSLAQLAISWTLRPGGVTSALIGVSSVQQLDENLAAAGRTDFSDEELAEIDRFAGEAGINIWAASSAN